MKVEDRTKVLPEEITLNLVLHILRNPSGWSEDSIRIARNWAADTLESIHNKLN